MKARFYMVMEVDGIKECAYNPHERVTHRYSCDECSVHVYGTFKNSRKQRHHLDYAVMLLVQEKGGRVGRLYHE